MLHLAKAKVRHEPPVLRVGAQLAFFAKEKERARARTSLAKFGRPSANLYGSVFL